MRKFFFFICLVGLAACGTSYRDNSVPLVAQGDFNPEKYLGLWYEIARFPVFFEKGCTATTARYGPVDAETVSVLNKCHKGTPDGSVEQIEGEAYIVGPGQLEVSFYNIPFLRGDYIVLWVDDTYRTAVVGTRSGKAGWILARTPEISSERREKAEAVLKSNGYNPAFLYDVPHD